MKGKLLNLILVCALVLAFFAVPAGAFANQKGPDGKKGQTEVTTKSQKAEEKIQPELMSEIRTAEAGKELGFMARITAGTDLSAYAETWFARPFVDPLGSTVAVGTARATELVKLAADPGVIKLQKPESLTQVPQAADPDVSDLLNAQITANLSSEASPGPAPEGWYGTTGAVHGSQEAWAKGYTGAGVRYMSNDSGADYCHPDLVGTWAYIDDAASPYYGLPEMFDSYSSYLAARDAYLGEANIANGLADYADTSQTATGNFSYQPIRAAVSHVYTVTGTSLSGLYHYGSHPDKALAGNAAVLSGAFGDGTAVGGERAAVLVVDENTAGVYDTVYVDLNYNFDFSDDTPARLSRDFSNQEVACLDYDLDGLNDVSGGLVYFISDGGTAVPTLDWLWGIPGFIYGSGDLVAFHVQDFTAGGGTHGQGTTSVAVGQGVVVGSQVWGPGGSPIANFQGLVVGPGKDVASTQNGDQYLTPFIEDAYLYAGLGYDGLSGTGDDIQIVSNSWGFSGTDNDGFDFESRLIDEINRALAPNTALLFSTGNGAPGYATVAPPSPPSGIGVGASTVYGSTGEFEAIASADQILSGDVMTWSNRGPGARNTVGADIVATGAWGTGDLSLNQVLWGATATLSFGGTSMAAPVAAGNLALMYQAWYERTGSWPTYDEARTLLMSTAKNIEHDVWSMGAGLVDADRGTDVAGGHAGIMVDDAQWSVGDYRGAEIPGFTNIIHPGDSDSKTFTVHNTGQSDQQVRLRAVTYRQLGTTDYSFTSLDQSMDHGNFTTPDYVFRIDQNIPNGTDMLMVRVTKPHNQFDPNEDLSAPFSNWRVHLQNWTDLDGDGQYWVDLNGNGKVDLGGEMDTGEHNRFTYGYNTGPNQEARISNPTERIDDGLLLTLRHRDRTPLVPNTDLTIEVSYWRIGNFNSMLSFAGPTTFKVGAGESRDFTARVRVKELTPYGMYEGAILATTGEDEVVIPVTIAVAAEGTAFTFGNTGQGDPIGKTPLYDNGYLFGYTDYAWRAESGDWRFFWTDVPDGSLPASGTPYLVVDTAWDSPGTDVDSIVMGPVFDGFDPAYYGPYTLDITGRSANTYIGSGRWLFQTSSGGPREIIAAPAQEGLHGIFLHQVRVDGAVLDEPFIGHVGLVTVDPGAVTGSGSGSLDVSINSEIDLSGFVAEGFGLGTPTTTSETVLQDNPNDPGTASFVTTVDVAHGALLEVSTGNSGGGSDIDLYVYGPDGSLLGSSTTPTDEEFVSITFPEDGTYTVAVHGWSVPAGSDTFDLTINAVQGFDVAVTALPAAIPAGGSGAVTVAWDTTGFAAGTYYGLVLMGPAEAPGLLQLPVEITVP